MEFETAKAKFIQAWGTLGSSWGINRTMSQIHALLIINTDPLTTEEIMAELKVSRGNVNMNIRALMEWGLVNKELVPGERKEYFSAGKDIWQVARQIAKERKRREVEPILDVISQVKNAEGDGKEVEEFNRMMQEIEDFTSKADTTLDKFIKSDENWFYKTLLTLMK
jgi:DNA-binding transcriptional regulator GbsR (MarR family)